MKIKILIVDDEQREIDAIIGALIPVDGIPDDDSSRIQIAKNKYDIRTFKVLGAAIYEILHNNYRPDIALVDINFSNLQQSDLDIFSKELNLILSKERGTKRGRDFEKEIKNISPKTLVRNVTYIGNADESTFVEFISGNVTPKFKNSSGDVNKMGEVGKAVLPLLKQVIINKVNENQIIKKRLNEWADSNFLPKNQKLVINGMFISANDFLVPWLCYKYDTGEITEANERLSCESFEDAIFPKKVDLNWDDLKFRKGLMAQLNNKGTLQKYYNHITDYSNEREKIDTKAVEFLNEYLDWYFNTRDDSFTPSININNLKKRLTTIHDLPEDDNGFIFNKTNNNWGKLENLFIIQRIICSLSAIITEEDFSDDMLITVVPYLRQSRSGLHSALDFVNKLGLSQEGDVAKYQLPYVMPDTAKFVAEYMKKRQNSD